MERVRTGFTFDNDAEMGVEVDPRVTTKEHLRILRQLGFNRISMGVQDFNPKVQEAINRVQPFEDTKALVDAARSEGFESINIDLIYGLPYQTVASFEKTIEQILSIGPDRLAVYSYAHVPWLKKHQEHFVAHLPDERQKFEIFRTALKRFTEAGFDYIGMDHFARPNDELSQARQNRTLWRNFQGYTTKAGTDLFGLGMSAIGNVHGGFFQNEKDLKTYQERTAKGGVATTRGFQLSKDDKIRSRVIQNLLCHADVLKKDIEKEFDLSFDKYFSDALLKLEEAKKDGLVELLADRIRPTNIGRVFLRNLAMPFDAYLPKEGEKKVFSRTV
jgi:oxygen-independent coproporphyrinogen-3 oxidase